MKIAETPKPSRFFAKDRRGVALITVLTVIALTTILVLTFFSLATSEHRASYTYSHGLQAQQIGEQAVNMVIAQIREATTVGTTKAWASQPGAIRVWDEAGNLEFAYKLYSDDVMKTQNASDFQTDFLDMASWVGRPEHYVDLNEPVIRGEKVYFPIVHPSASAIPTWPKPIGDDRDGVEGFSFNTLTNRNLSAAGSHGETAARIAGSRDGHVAMPVKWIYQLADGTMGVINDAASGGGGQEAFTFLPKFGTGTPSRTNPIVARFAFWADDETTKLNINTHAGGLAWDIPKAGGELDMNMGKYQPAQKEWQRYPGHPATVHISAALAPGVLDIVNDRDAMEMLYRVIPRVVGGGSESGTRIIDTRREEEKNGLIADKEPLFPTIDDIIMRSDREPHEFPDAKGNPIPPRELSEYLERSKFFITANSRAPETNLFNLPRVAIWPIYNASYDSPDYKTKLSPFDRLIHYCASLGENTDGSYPRHEYIFRRENADSPTHDYALINRNITLYNYLRDLLERPVPGFKDSFAVKYDLGGHKQLLTQIFDYIRTTNLHDDSIFEDFEEAFADANTSGARTYTNPRSKANPSIGHKGHGQVVPIQIEDTRGFGRFYTLGSVQVQLISCAEPVHRRYPRNLGAHAYNRARMSVGISNTARLEDEESLFISFPPHPAGFEKPDNLKNPPEAYTKVEPNWLKELRENPAKEEIYLEAMHPGNWNWQLAFLDDQYTKAVLDQPSVFKFNRKALSQNAFTTEVTYLNPNGPNGAEQLVQGALWFNLFSPSIGWGSINPDMEIKVEVEGNTTNMEMYFDAAGGQPEPGKAQFLGFWDDYSEDPLNRWPRIRGSEDKDTWIFATNRSDTAWGGRRYGGLMPYEYLLYAPGSFVQGRHFNQVARDAAVPAMGLPRNMGATAFRSNFNANFWDGSLKNYREWHQGEYPKFPDHDISPPRQNAPGDQSLHGINVSYFGGNSRLTPLDRGYDLIAGLTGLNADTAQGYRYDLVTLPFKVNRGKVITAGGQELFVPAPVKFNGGDLKFTFYHGGKRSERSAPNGDPDSYGIEGEPLQEITVHVPDFEISDSKGNHRESDSGVVAPSIYNHTSIDVNKNGVDDWTEHLGAYYNEFDALQKDSFSFLERVSLGADPANPVATKSGAGTRSRGKSTKISFSDTKLGTNHRIVPTGRFGQLAVHARPTLFSYGDIVQSIEVEHGDARLVAGRYLIKRDELFKPHRNYNETPLAHSATTAVGGGYIGAKIEREYVILPGLVASGKPYNGRVPLPFGVKKSEVVQLYGDFDNGSGLMIDGPYINKPDEGNVHSLQAKWKRSETDYWEQRRNYGEFPYFNRDDIQETGGPAYFSPNRIVSGPGTFGSMPTGVVSNEPWRTLLFRPVTRGIDPGFLPHPGGDDPPDHLIMDLFWMPVVEPYAISEPLSTGGKINLNFDIVPFQHVQRSTALRGVFRSEMMLCIPNKWHVDYKHNHGRGRGYHWRDNPYGGQLQGKRLRSVILDDPTIAQFMDKFDDGADIFKSSTQICEIHLIPQEVSERLGRGGAGAVGSYTPRVAQMENGSYWQDHSLVGDNSRERPYANIQARVTTKSNTFLVHYRAQVLKQSRRESDGEYAVWRPSVDSVQAEYRGSSMVERYVDPEATDIPDFAEGSGALDGLDAYYRYRVVNPKRFAP